MREKFGLVQALRGAAALWVVMFHLDKSGAISGVPVIHPVLVYGSAGVAVFFVLSGFVIAHSLDGVTMTPRELGRFALKRSVRLDPSYLASMAVVIGVGMLEAATHRSSPVLPSPGQIVAHVFYVQELLREPEIEVVYWTLTYEIQFYLVFAASKMVRRSFWPLYGLALVAAFEGHEWALHGLFVNLWHGFFLGVLAYRCGYLKERAWPLLLLAAVTIIGRDGVSIFAVPCACTSLLLFVAARTGKLANAPMQWLGAISYSLYLVHVPVLRLFTGPWQHLVGRGEAKDTLAALFLLWTCLGAAWLFYLTIERPSHKLAKRLGRRVGNDDAALSTITAVA